MKWLAAKVTPFAALLGLVFANDLPDLLVRDVSLALGFALLLAIFVPLSLLFLRTIVQHTLRY